ncbi:hypothetical protein [Kitasatospora cinereorecta]|uniref:Uncharacterized protein n=1 Tax=Kitasatospora cinereorecta TaxID=285560 RepID=A0ABW0V7J0_9ACTN
MSTYAAVTAVPAEQVLTALGTSKLGGYLYRGTPDAPGTSVLFDPPKPRFGRISRRRLVAPASNLAFELQAPVWLIESTEGGAGATACYADGGCDGLGWAADWTPPADPAELAAHLADWNENCGALAGKAGLADPAALAAIRNDPAADGTRTGSDELLRRLCALVGAPPVVVGQSLFRQAGPAGREFTRFEARGH